MKRTLLIVIAILIVILMLGFLIFSKKNFCLKQDRIHEQCKNAFCDLDPPSPFERFIMHNIPYPSCPNYDKYF